MLVLEMNQCQLNRVIRSFQRGYRIVLQIFDIYQMLQQTLPIEEAKPIFEFYIFEAHDSLPIVLTVLTMRIMQLQA